MTTSTMNRRTSMVNSTQCARPMGCGIAGAWRSDDTFAMLGSSEPFIGYPNHWVSYLGAFTLMTACGGTGTAGISSLTAIRGPKVPR